MTKTAAAAPLLLFAAFLQTKSCPDSGAAHPSATPSPSPRPTAPPPSPPPAPTVAADLFATVIRPVVKSHCAPCHEPGGKMYGRLPFDDPKVLSSHSEGVLRRLKGEDREAFERWIASLK